MNDDLTAGLVSREQWLAERRALRESVLTLKAQGLNAKEIGRYLDLPYSRVRSILAYARRISR